MTKTAEQAQSHRFFPEVEHFRNIARLHRLPTGFPECLGALPLRISQDHTLRSSFTELFRRMQQTYSDFTVNDAVWMLLTAIGGHTAANRQVAPEGVFDFAISFVTSIGGWPEARRSSVRSPEPHRAADPLHYPAATPPPANFYEGSRGSELSTRYVPPAPSASYEAAPPRNDALEQITQTLARLERSTGDLRLYLDSVDQRLSRLEPLLDIHQPQPMAPEPPAGAVAPAAVPLVHRSDAPPAIPPAPQPLPPADPPTPSVRAAPRPRFAAAMDLPQTNSTFAAPFQHHSPPLRPAAPARPPYPPEPTGTTAAPVAPPEPPAPEPQSRIAASVADHLPQPSDASPTLPAPLAPPPQRANPAPTSVLKELNRISSAPLPQTPRQSAAPAPDPFQAQAHEPLPPNPPAQEPRVSEPRIPDPQLPDRQLPDRQFPDRQLPDFRIPDRQIPATQPPDRQPPAPRVPAPHTPEQRLPDLRPLATYDPPPVHSHPDLAQSTAPPFTQRAPVAPSAPPHPVPPEPHTTAATFTSAQRSPIASPEASQPAQTAQDNLPRLSGRPLPTPPTFGTDLFGQHSPEDHDELPKRSRTPLILGLFAALLVALALAVLARGRPLPSWTRIAPALTGKPAAAQQDDPGQAPADNAATPSPTNRTPARSADSLGSGKVLGARAEEAPQASEQVLHSLPYVPELTLRSRLISGSPALYPRSPGGEAVRGTIALQVIVRPDGTVGTVNVLGGPRPLRDAAINAVRRWRFQPVLVHGVPAQIRSTLHVPVEPPDRQ